jgi:hypothetical protein
MTAASGQSDAEGAGGSAGLTVMPIGSVTPSDGHGPGERTLTRYSFAAFILGRENFGGGWARPLLQWTVTWRVRRRGVRRVSGYAGRVRLAEVGDGGYQ